MFTPARFSIFGDKVNVGRAVFFQEVSYVENILRLGYEGAGNEVHLLFDAEDKVFLVLFGEVDELELLFGEEHALSARKLASDKNLAKNFGLRDFNDLEYHESVV